METARKRWSFTITPMRLVFAALAVLGILMILVRLIWGLGVATNQNDQWTWGLWKFVVFTGIALGGSGFTMAFMVFILRRDQFFPVARIGMLISLIAYITGILGLFVDIGQWFNFWTPFVSWGHESVLFEVLVCITIYAIVQVLEFCEVATEKVFKGYHKYFKAALPVLLVIGVTLPTLHQSSLGGLYYLMLGKLDPLWSSQLIAPFFLVTSLFVGPAMMAVVIRLCGKAFNYDVDPSVLKGLIRIAGALMVLYLGMKIVDLAIAGNLGRVFAFDYASIMFLIELGAGVLIPIFIAFSKSAGTSKGQTIFGLLTVGGVVLNRFNMVFTGVSEYFGQYGSAYFPSWIEVIVCLGLISIGCLAFLFLSENFSVFSHRGDEPTVGIMTEDGRYAFYK
ncbi:Polysulphide reductase NrfD [Syntrophobotulus glycolicus DSM 8271]|uniref:Polysulphide reductase NrfD n=1 Tax=Syntrophobotulus glycolicus (strain DSM 8271 / FlGlyR) TaxID=645991 RepID=F0T2S3_SYNGF|nr:NrfD/PsrC family molybdoenzyme membrane anchor subunit [Syntrophobotulus glycolicus]ADY56472.1 Polysulphide reductase NrfD [Syntrophobotulus glycolicus DSM 8271]ADY56475.1 Polysulphide reductase NrfD [Syntrophobotulus glycolicus DSM 8271]